MAMNRKKAEAMVLEGLALYPGGNNEVNLKAYKDFFKRINDEEFEQWIQAMERGEITIRYCKRNFVSHKHDRDIIKAFEPMFKYLGRPIEQRFWDTDTSTGEKALSKFPGLLLYANNRMLNQMIVKKRRFAKNSNRVDELTGQVTGKSRASSYSAPETIITMGKGHKYLNLDMLKIHGGDERGYAMAMESVYNTGTYSIDAILEQETNTTSVVIYSVLLTAMHYKNNFWKEG